MRTARGRRTSFPSEPSFLMFGFANRSFMDTFDRWYSVLSSVLTIASRMTSSSLVSASSEYPLPVREESHSRAMCIVSPPKPHGTMPALPKMCLSNA